MDTVELITQKFTNFGFEILEWQKDDRAVGIFEGWVVYKNESEEDREITWSEALYLESKEEIIKESRESTY